MEAVLSRKLVVVRVAIRRSAKDGFRSRFVCLCDRKGSSGPAFLQADAVWHPSVMPSV
jgi:hypothetical protein